MLDNCSIRMNSILTESDLSKELLEIYVRDILN